MPLPLDKFIKQLEDSGVLAGDTLKDFLPPKNEPKDAEELARELVRRKKLTKFQAEEVYKGKGKSLVLGNYVLMEKIGAGGMGQVFKARHRRMDRLVAVKLLPTAVMKDKAAVARFEREVKAAAKISHPNIVAAYDADQADGVHFLAMELVDGSDLSALVKKSGPFPVDKAVNFVLQAARGLEAAHAEGVVHRDIKPANLLLDNKGVVKILDMGLARLNAEGDGSPQADLTNTGTIMGTVDYMAPEQALDTKSADARADIYALGCSLFFLLTGKATYEGDTIMKKLLAHREQPIPRLRSVCPEASEQLEAVFTKMVAQKIGERYQTMTDVIADLEDCGSRQSITCAPQETINVTGNLLQEASVFPNTLVLKKVQRKPTNILRDKRPLLIGGGLLGVLILLAGLAISIRTKDGTLIVAVNEADADVQVLNEEGKVEITRKGEREPITISVDPGKHRLKVTKVGFAVFAKEFEIEAGGKRPITAKLEPLEKQPAIVGTKTLSNESDGLGFVNIFNGRDLTGWTVIGDQGNWDVDASKGILAATGKPGGWLLTNNEYADFVLRLEYQAEAEANSGVAILASPADKDHLEVQISRIVGWATGGVWSDLANTTDAGFIPVACPAQEKSGQEWNALEIDFRSRQLKIAVNGSEVLKLDVNELANRPNAYPAWKRTRGRIGLQSQTNKVRFRNVRLEEIVPASESLARWDTPAFQQWHRLNPYWTITPQEITGSTVGGGLEFNTFLCSNRSYRDFEVTCQVWLKKNNSGIQIRSEFVDQNKCILKGPQVDMGPNYWGSLYGEQTTGLMQDAPADFGQRFVKPNEFNDVSVRCVGKHVTLKINGQTSIDRDFPEIADEGIIGLQCSRSQGGEKLVFAQSAIWATPWVCRSMGLPRN
ncbi:MAG TPA: family 16 glycoside hydrolase [Pirellulales bacterium]|nr:family 16 glycoside hydrolase [Pirellulales bacterium]